MSTALLYNVLKWDETENWAGVARNWSWGEQEAGFFLAAASSYIFRVTKGCGLETCGELTGHQNLSSSNFHTRCYFRLQLRQAYPSHVV